MTAAAMAAMLVSSGAARSEVQFGIYGGWNGSFDSDVTVTRGNSDFTLHDVPWQGLSFDFDGGAPYYGFRGTYWLPSSPWGVMLDYIHAKVRADPDATVDMSGTYRGKPAPSRTRIDDVFDRFEFTDGLNLITINAVRQFEMSGGIRPYVGAGIGLADPHVEVEGPGFPETFEYQIAGPAAQVLAGLDVLVNRYFSLFGEYKLTYAGIDADLTGGGELKTGIWTNHLIVGLAVRFGPR
ncbi:MAG TPA: outer membrane beta-barrel protein [Bauldia sp.]|nr:outer membrane beta-barrel protein [Bauldia sp.]